jgi:CDP-diacylglycerol--glycerol-3-phosphate 3-phosphatidyltransferase
MLAIVFLLYDAPLFAGIDSRMVGTWLIYIACGLTIWSMAYYLKKSLPDIRAKAR